MNEFDQAHCRRHLSKWFNLLKWRRAEGMSPGWRLFWRFLWSWTPENHSPNVMCRCSCTLDWTLTHSQSHWNGQQVWYWYWHAVERELLITCLRSPTCGMEVNGAVSGAEEWWTGQVQWSSVKHHTTDVGSVGDSTLNLVISVQKQFKPANILVVYPVLLVPDR